jgi:hypothetical protein
MHEKQSLTIPTVLPCSSQLMRSLYMKRKNAILPNLPRPSIRMIDEHAYVSLHDCVADLLGHGLDVQHISEIDPLDAAVIDASKCHFSQQIYARGISWIKIFHLLIHYGMVGWLSAIYFLKDQ